VTPAYATSGRLRYVSFGAGVQSSALLVMAALGLRGCPKADFAVFADTQDEPQWVYDHMAVMKAWSEARGLEVITVTAGRLSTETYGHAAGTQKRRAALPVFTLGQDGRAALLPRQCTYEYKLAPIEKYLRLQLGYQPRQRIPAGSATALIGLSFDELFRMKPSRKKWITNQWPLIDAAISRSGCMTILEEQGLPIPRKSACIYCPFHDDAYWLDLQRVEPQSFDEACRFDDAVRSVSKSGLRQPVFLHRSLIPLRDVTFDAGAQKFDGFGNECEGACGV
jgi:hypothetical protein